MKIISLIGGLGNQLFQYAFYRNTELLGISSILDISYFNESKAMPLTLKIFPKVRFKTCSCNWLRSKNFVCRCLRKILKLVYLYKNEDMATGFDYEIKKVQNGYCNGYFQDTNYFLENKDVIISELDFPFGESNLSNIIKIVEEDNTVSIHIRRGDYLKLDDIYGGICTDKYYKKAIEYFSYIKQPKFIVFSNDIDWVKENMKIPNAMYIESGMFENYQDWYDMCIMSHCHHNILANSTFSWWGAFLNKHSDKIVICPTRWENQHPNRKMCCEDWIEIQS